MEPPIVEPESDWEEFTLPFEIGSGRSMFVETPNGPTIRMRFFRSSSDGALVGRVWFGSVTFGPPGFVHGGLVSYVLDEAMGTCVWLEGYPSVAANLNFDFVEMTPLQEDCLVEACHGSDRCRTVLANYDHRTSRKPCGRSFVA